MDAGVSLHAAVRVRQRGIDQTVLDCLLDFGTAIHDHRGAEILIFDKRAQRRLQRAVDKRLYKRVQENTSLYAVRSVNGDLITVGYRFRRVLRM
jgi:hypothetical protein